MVEIVDTMVLLIKYSFQVSVALKHQKHNGIFKHVLAFAVALRLPAQPGQEMPEQAVVALDRVSFSF
jgi:hypothetical protein